MATFAMTRGLRLATLFLTCLTFLQKAFAIDARGGRQLKGQVTSRKLPSVVRRADKASKEPEKRTCDMSEKVDKVEFKCKTKSETGDSEDGTEEKIKDELKFKIESSSEGLVVKVEYEYEIETDAMETETETKYEITFGSIIEYAKASSTNSSDGNVEDDAYDYDNDEVVQSFPLSTWLDFSEVSLESDVGQYHFNLSSGDEMAWFGFTVSEADPEAGDSTTSGATANKMKIDFKLTSFPWDREDTNVALLTTVESKMKVEVEYEDDHDHDHDHEDDDHDHEHDESKEKPKKPKDVKISFQEALEATGVVPFGDITWATEAMAVQETSAGDGTDVITNPDDGTVVSQAAEPGTEGADEEEMNTESFSVSNYTASIQVVATSPATSENDKVQSIAFSFVGGEDGASHHASELIWDPQAGVGYEDVSGDSSAAVSKFGPLSTCTVVGMVVCALSIFV